MSKVKPSFIAWRFYCVLSLIFIIVIGLIIRVYDLSIRKQGFLRHQGNERVLRTITMPAFRGMIKDRNGFPLAISTPVFAVWIEPHEFNPDDLRLTELANLVQVPIAKIKQTVVNARVHRRLFQYLKRGLGQLVATELKNLAIPGLYLQKEYHRYYPEGEVMVQVLGITNVDDSGQEGIELAYNDWLRGEPGRILVIKDRLGRVIDYVQNLKSQRAGSDVALSIDRRLQYLAYRELLNGVKENQAQSASAVVLDVKTGEILAMVNVPSFDPNVRSEAKKALRNRAATDTFEPGSTIKAFTIASALESGLYKPTSIIDTAPGSLRIGHNMVHDVHKRGLLSLGEILQYSSNVGASKIALSLPPNYLWNMLHRVGFGEETGILFPGEQAGVLTKPNSWAAFILATLSFGYGLSVTTLQLVRAYGVVANDGVKLPLSLLKLATPPQGEQVMTAKIAHILLSLLEVSGASFAIPGYRIAAKTGTSKQVGISGYQKHHYNSTCIGIGPVTKPRIVVAVVMNDPQGKKYYGALVSGPVFQKIMSGSLRILQVAPDFPTTNVMS